MWGKNSSSPKSLASAFQSGAGETTYIAAESEFTGNITLKGNARIDGQIEGVITLTGDLVIGPSAVIKATIQANTISISGEVRGDITASESLELCSSARLYGNIYTQQLKIDQGAQFIGSSRLLGDAVEEPAHECVVNSVPESIVDSIAAGAEEAIEEHLEEADCETSDSTITNIVSHTKAVGSARSSRSKRK